MSLSNRLPACTCGAEPQLHVDMSSGPGCLCRISCDCGALGNAAWDIKIPWDDLIADWVNDTERELRRALKMGFVIRDSRGSYTLTDLGRAVAAAQTGSNQIDE